MKKKLAVFLFVFAAALLVVAACKKDVAVTSVEIGSGEGSAWVKTEVFEKTVGDGAFIISARVLPDNATNKKVTWAIIGDNADGCAIDADGRFTLGAGAGSVTVKATAAANGLSVTAVVNISAQAQPGQSALDRIEITTQPAKTAYIAGQTFSADGLSVTAVYADGTSKAVAAYSVSKTASLAVTDTKITISYTENNITKTADVAITVTAKTL
ncbi:MAG: bacterial Ig-like domain-containing protein, partial [Clostridiales bacterium]|nr:bacterial Ig-like domain-containing protein [Clostridiales bacterium]